MLTFLDALSLFCG